MPRPKPVVLAILDGWGIAPKSQGNAVALANTPTIDMLTASFPHTRLLASGDAVGLPPGEDGNTETGHLNLGAGQIVYQDLPRINQSIADGSFNQNKEFLGAISHIKQYKSRLHVLGLVSSGGVHSSLEHLFALLRLCAQHELHDVAVHVITDGRDSPPTSSINYINQIIAKLKETNVGFISTLMGRYYAMDRDHRWERTEIAYNALTVGQGKFSQNPEEAIVSSYQEGKTDEFITPVIFTDNTGQPIGLVKDNDAVIFYNFRIDRPRQLTKAFVLPNLSYVTSIPEGFDPYAVKYLKSHLPQAKPKTDRTFTRQVTLKNLNFVTMTEYEKGLPVSIAFPPQSIINPLGRVISDAGLRQLRMAETEKERFVTYYLNGQREDPFPGEDRIIIPSPPVPTYDQKPEMSSIELTQTLIERLHAGTYDFIAINFANPDMVGHTGNLQAGIKACEYTDTNLMRITDVVLALGGIVFITADHGNVEEMLNLETGAVDTEHSTNPVPLIVVGEKFRNKPIELPQGILGDVAPSILACLEIEKPPIMTGRNLVEGL